MSSPLLFLDDGGVMNDNRLREPEWKRLVAEFFGSRFGPGDWAAANARALEVEMRLFSEFLTTKKGRGFNAFIRNVDYLWIKTMFEFIGLEVPPFEEAIRLTRSAASWIAPRVRSAVPGISETIPKLHELLSLHTASNEDSTLLHGYLTGMGVRQYFGTLYGPDLIDIAKGSPDYFLHIFDRELPSLAIVVDDSPKVLEFAEEAGAVVIQSVITGGEPEFDNSVADFRDLPDLVRQILRSG